MLVFDYFEKFLVSTLAYIRVEMMEFCTTLPPHPTPQKKTESYSWLTSWEKTKAEEPGPKLPSRANFCSGARLLCGENGSHSSLICRGDWSLQKFRLIEPNAGCTLSPNAFGESCPRWDWVRATLYTLSESSQFWRATRGDSQVRHETTLTRAHGPLKKRDLNEARHECQGYTRGSKAKRVFPSTLSLSPCLGFPQRECTAGIRVASPEKISLF